jgi:hypothetical protein
MSAVLTPAVKAKRTRYAGLSYFDLVAEAEKPIAERRSIPIGRRGNETIQRRFHKLASDIDQLSAAHRDGDKFPSPFNKANYHYLLLVLVKHALSTADRPRKINLTKLVAEFRDLTNDKSTRDASGQTFWQRFKNKESRNPDTGLDYDGRILQNLQVMQRITGKTPYGIKIDQIAKAVLGLPGACIDITKGRGGEIFVSLNLNPQNFAEFTCNPNHVPVGYTAVERDGKHYVTVAQPVDETKRRKVADEDEGEGDGESEPEVKVVKARKPRAAKADKAVEQTETPSGDAVTEPVAAQPEAVEAVESDQPTGACPPLNGVEHDAAPVADQASEVAETEAVPA